MPKLSQKYVFKKEHAKEVLKKKCAREIGEELGISTVYVYYILNNGQGCSKTLAKEISRIGDNNIDYFFKRA